MPGGRSALGAVGGLGAFMYGTEDDDPPDEQPVPRHQRMQVPRHNRKHAPRIWPACGVHAYGPRPYVLHAACVPVNAGC
jgi:hypothetical protein